MCLCTCVLPSALIWILNCSLFCLNSVPGEQNLGLLQNTWYSEHLNCVPVCVCVSVYVFRRSVHVQVVVPGGQRRAVLENLLPDTEYKVTVTPVYMDRQDGVSVSALGSTCKSSNSHTHCFHSHEDGAHHKNTGNIFYHRQNNDGFIIFRKMKPTNLTNNYLYSKVWPKFWSSSF